MSQLLSLIRDYIETRKVTIINELKHQLKTGGGLTLYLRFNKHRKRSWGKDTIQGHEEGFIEILNDGSIWLFTHWRKRNPNYSTVLGHLQPNKCGYGLYGEREKPEMSDCTETEKKNVEFALRGTLDGRYAPRWVKKLTKENYIETLSHYIFSHDKVP